VPGAMVCLHGAPCVQFVSAGNVRHYGISDGNQLALVRLWS